MCHCPLATVLGPFPGNVIRADDVARAARFLARPLMIAALVLLLVFSLVMAARETYPLIGGAGLSTSLVSGRPDDAERREREVDAQAEAILAGFEAEHDDPKRPGVAP
jgi:hypothetical protein